MKQAFIALLLIVFGCIISQADVNSNDHQLCNGLWWQSATPDDLIPFSYDEIFFHQICDDFMNTPLHKAAKYADRDVAKKLFKMDIVNILVEDIYGKTPFSLAQEEAAQARHDFVKIPFDQGDVQSRHLRLQRAYAIEVILSRHMRRIERGEITIQTDFRYPSMPYNAN